MITALIGGASAYAMGVITSGSYDVIKKSLRNVYKVQVLQKKLISGFYLAVEDVKKQHHNRLILQSLDSIKTTFQNVSPEIKKTIKAPTITPKKRNELFVEHCHIVFSDQNLPDDVQDELIGKILKNCSDILKEMLYNYPDEFQKEVISILEKTSKDNNEFRNNLQEIITYFENSRIETIKLHDKLDQIESDLRISSYNHSDNSLEQLKACRNYRQSDAAKLLIWIEQANDQLPNQNLLEMFYLKEYCSYIPDAIQSEIRCGNLKSKQLFKKIDEIKDQGKTLDLVYWVGDVFHLLDNYEMADRTLSNIKNIKEGKFSNIFDIRLLQAHILTHKNQMEPSKLVFKSLLEEDLSVTQKAECLFRIGEICVFQGFLEEAITAFSDSNRLIYRCKNEVMSPEDRGRLDRFEADNHRKMGTAYLLGNQLDNARKHYDISYNLYSRSGPRGKVWLLHGQAELERLSGRLPDALRKYQLAETASHRVLNINRVAHSYLGAAEVLRMQGRPDFDLYAKCFTIYQDIKSDWGLANTYISRGLAYLVTNNEREGWNEIGKAKAICLKMQLGYEQTIIDNLADKDPKTVLHPLSFY